ncbi:MmgE/PrpD family protein [Sphingobium lignivorans]|uniref:2-methylcitrate dehydratase PrpD n=1 Tax=Sphingobium lignivorans TaxID=2735886 RepID=A0ABR6NHL8_9SPHN|nr:MmgE/PrpD family protein [Sphingobium lignivorans]MBB5986774.1 2-methylcitrate dehydratase PrpD [Sphingobium lignivorans]
MSASDRMALGRRTVLAGAALALPAATLAASTPPPAPAPTRAARQKPAPSREDGGLSAVIANHVASARFDQLDAGARERTKLRLLDVIGCAIGGLRGENQRSMSELLASDSGGDATVFGLDRKASVPDAAMANAMLARAFDFEVMTVKVRDVISPSHNAPTTVMTALALAEAAKSDGKAFLTSLALGDDLAARSIAASGLDFNDGWDGVPLHVTMAAAAIAAHSRKLSPEKARQALGIAADQIGGTVQNVWDGANSWKILQGTAARNGVLAARFAEIGWSGMTDPLLSPCGFYAQFTAGCARPDLLTGGLGQEWNGEIYFKPWPSCAATHPAIESALTLRAREKLDPATIDSVTIEVEPRILGLFISKPLRAGPSLHSQTNFSLAFACATALLRGDLRQEDYALPAIADPALVSLIERTTLTQLPAGETGIRLGVRRRDGTVLTERLIGRPRRYAGSTVEEVERKFYQQVAFAGNVPKGLADELRQRIGEVEKERDMASFAALLSRATRYPG